MSAGNPHPSSSLWLRSEDETSALPPKITMPLWVLRDTDTSTAFKLAPFWTCRRDGSKVSRVRSDPCKDGTEN